MGNYTKEVNIPYVKSVSQIYPPLIGPIQVLQQDLRTVYCLVKVQNVKVHHEKIQLLHVQTNKYFQIASQRYNCL